MDHFNYSKEIREDIPAAYRQFWARLARPGNWWSGADRVAIAAESRRAIDCGFCAARKQALSPYTFAGEHDHSGVLPVLAVDAVHRIITDQARITRGYIERNATEGLSREAYVELAGIVVCTFSIDEFHRALGMPLEPLPAAEPGEPDQYRPEQAAQGTGFVPMIPAEGPMGNEEDLWLPGLAPNVLRAFSLVPDAVRDWRKIAEAQYLSFEGMQNFGQPDNRTINRMQIELVAGRVSSINECFY